MRRTSVDAVDASSQEDPDSPESLAAVNSQYDGYCADLSKHIAEAVGFRYRIVPVRDVKYGAVDDETGKWNGMVGELIRHVRNCLHFVKKSFPKPITKCEVYLFETPCI